MVLEIRITERRKFHNVDAATKKALDPFLVLSANETQTTDMVEGGSANLRDVLTKVLIINK